MNKEKSEPNFVELFITLYDTEYYFEKTKTIFLPIKIKLTRKGRDKINKPFTKMEKIIHNRTNKRYRHVKGYISYYDEFMIIDNNIPSFHYNVGYLI